MADALTVPKVATLDGFADVANENQGISLSELGAGRVVIVETEDSSYTIKVLDPSERTVEVVGGEHFPKSEVCVLSGSTFGGTMLKMGWIGLGMYIEFHKSTNQIITTSPVIAVSLPGPTSDYVH